MPASPAGQVLESRGRTQARGAEGQKRTEARWTLKHIRVANHIRSVCSVVML